MLSLMHLYPIDGAAHRVGPNETPWSYREAKLGNGHRRRRSRPGQLRDHHRVGAGVLGSYTPALGRWSIHQHDDGGVAGSSESLLPRQLRAAGGDQARLRPGESLSRQPEHQAVTKGAIVEPERTPMRQLLMPDTCSRTRAVRGRSIPLRIAHSTASEKADWLKC
jgi:hypothetical protein